MEPVDLPHPVTGQRFPSPVPPGCGWPGDPATASTRVARSAAGVQRLAAAADPGQLDARVSVCAACPRLVAWRTEVARTKRAAYADQPYWGRPVPGWGSPDAPVLVVGLAPGAHGAARTGRNFTGDDAGDWLFGSLHRTGFASAPTSRHTGDGTELHRVRITPAVHCVPPDNVPTPDELAACSPWLRAELRLTGAGVLVALGAVAWRAVLGAARHDGWQVPRPAPRFGHAAQVTLHRADGGEVVLLGCYHPSRHNTATGRLTASMLDQVFTRAAALGGCSA